MLNLDNELGDDGPEQKYGDNEQNNNGYNVEQPPADNSNGDPNYLVQIVDSLSDNTRKIFENENMKRLLSPGKYLRKGIPEWKFILCFMCAMLLCYVVLYELSKLKVNNFDKRNMKLLCNPLVDSIDKTYIVDKHGAFVEIHKKSQFIGTNAFVTCARDAGYTGVDFLGHTDVLRVYRCAYDASRNDTNATWEVTKTFACEFDPELAKKHGVEIAEIDAEVEAEAANEQNKQKAKKKETEENKKQKKEADEQKEKAKKEAAKNKKKKKKNYSELKEEKKNGSGGGKKGKTEVSGEEKEASGEEFDNPNRVLSPEELGVKKDSSASNLDRSSALWIVVSLLVSALFVL